MICLVSTHSRAEAAAWSPLLIFYITLVSTHSRAEAAADIILSSLLLFIGFNTQPRGGGCHHTRARSHYSLSFNTQPRGGGCCFQT